MNIKIGIIGGSGLDNPDLFADPLDIEISNQWVSLHLA